MWLTRTFQNNTGMNQYDTCKINDLLVPRNFHVQTSVFPYLNWKQEQDFDMVESAGFLKHFEIHQVSQCYIILRSSLYTYCIIVPFLMTSTFSNIVLNFGEIMCVYIYLSHLYIYLFISLSISSYIYVIYTYLLM